MGDYLLQRHIETRQCLCLTQIDKKNSEFTYTANTREAI